ASMSVFGGTWSGAYTLKLGQNNVIVRALGRHGEEIGRVENSVYYRPPPAQLRITAPTRMTSDGSITLRVDALDYTGAIDWRRWDEYGQISVTRVSDNSVVPFTTTVFDTHDGLPPFHSIRCYNGVGSVSITLDNANAEPAGNLRFAVTLGGV